MIPVQDAECDAECAGAQDSVSLTEERSQLRSRSGGYTLTLTLSSSQEQDMSRASWVQHQHSLWETLEHTGWQPSHSGDNVTMLQVVIPFLLTLTSARPEPESPSSLLLRSLAWLRLPGLSLLLPARPQQRTLAPLSSLPMLRLLPSLSRTKNRDKRVRNNNRQLCENKITANNFLLPLALP